MILNIYEMTILYSGRLGISFDDLNALQDFSTWAPFIWEPDRTILYEHTRLTAHSTPIGSLFQPSMVRKQD